MNVLITSASRKVSLISAFREALIQHGGGKVVAVDTSPLSAALYLAEDHYLVPRSGAPGFLAIVLRLCKAHDIGLVIPTRDEELPFFAEHRQRFADEGVLVMVAAPATVATCQDKRAFVDFCLANRFEVPETYYPETLPPNLPFPLFVKDRFGKGGVGAVRVNSSTGLAAALEQFPDAVVQRFIADPEYTLDLFADFSGTVISVVPRERVHVVGGEAFVSRTSKNPALIREGVRLAEKLHLVGHNTLQCFLSRESVKFIEVNPRFGGAANLGFAAGAHTPGMLIELLNGRTLEPRIGDFTDNHVMLRYTEDVFLDYERLTARWFR